MRRGVVTYYTTLACARSCHTVPLRMLRCSFQLFPCNRKGQKEIRKHAAVCDGDDYSYSLCSCVYLLVHLIDHVNVNDPIVT